MKVKPKEAHEFILRCREDPKWFCEKVLGVKLWDGQVSMLEAIRDNPRVVASTAQGIGKTMTLACATLWHTVSFQPSTALTTAPSWQHLREVLWGQIHKLYYDAKMDGELLTTALYFKSPQGKILSEALGISTNEPEKIQGHHNDYVFVGIDEAPGVGGEIHEAKENPLASGETRLFMIGNPREASGPFFDACNSPLYKSFNISAFDTPNFEGITLDDIRTTEARDGELIGKWKEKVNVRFPMLVAPAKVAEQWLIWGESSPLWDVYVMGQFPVEGADTLFPLAWVEAARTRDVKPEGGIIWGMDTAGSGGDENIICVRQGAKQIAQEVKSEADTNKIVKWAEGVAERWYPSWINIDAAPIGAGVVKQLREKGYPVHEVSFGGKARHPDKYGNARAEMYWNLREHFQNGTIQIIDDPILRAQLSVIKLKYRRQGTQVVLDDKYIEEKQKMKSEMKAVSGRPSPDRADALALAFYQYSAVDKGKNVKRMFRYGR